MKREELLRVLRCVRGVASATSTIEAFSSVFFDGERASAYDGLVMVSTSCELPLACGVPFAPFDAWVRSVVADEIELTCSSGTVIFTAGRATLKLPTLPYEQFTFEEPRGVGAEVREVEVMDSVRALMPYVSSDPGPSYGVTFSAFGDVLSLYASDNLTISVHRLAVLNSAQVDAVVPPRFAKTLVDVDSIDAFSSIEFGDGWVSATFLAGDEADTRIVSHVMADSYSATYEDILDRRLEQTENESEAKPVFEELKRLLTVLNASGIEQVYFDAQDGRLIISGIGSNRSVHSGILQVDCTDVSASFPAKEALRVLSIAESFTIQPDALVAWGDGFVNMVAASV